MKTDPRFRRIDVLGIGMGHSVAGYCNTVAEGEDVTPVFLKRLTKDRIPVVPNQRLEIANIDKPLNLTTALKVAS